MLRIDDQTNEEIQADLNQLEEMQNALERHYLFWMERGTNADVESAAWFVANQIGVCLTNIYRLIHKRRRVLDERKHGKAVV